MHEFTGKTEQEAIEQACETLVLESSQFDVEILENEGGLLRKGSVRIRVYPHRESEQADRANREEQSWRDDADEHIAEELDGTHNWQELIAPNVWQAQVCHFMQGLLQRMGQEVKLVLYSRGAEQLLLSVQHSSAPSQLIGKHGKHLESLQIVLNAYLGRLYDEENEVPSDLRVQLDVGGYRKRCEVKLVKLARSVADQVETRKTSRLLEAMNPFERRIVHQALNDWPNISTISEGNGLYKQIRVIYRGSSY